MEAYKTYHLTEHHYEEYDCTPGVDIVKHTKQMPKCHNVTKQNCVTKWETDVNGKQVWAGNEDCEPVTWKECKLVPTLVDFKVPTSECNIINSIPYQDCVEDLDSRMTTSMLCQVKHTTSCKPKITEKCASITYRECQEKPNPQPACKPVTVQIPYQDKVHKKKCLLADDGSHPHEETDHHHHHHHHGHEETTSSDDQAATPPAAPTQPTYGVPRGGRQPKQLVVRQDQQVRTQSLASRNPQGFN